MYLNMMKGKIHRATVTEANVDYVGSITIDRTLMDAAGLLENEKVQVCDINNGARFETYVIEGKADSGVICLNGAAAKLVEVGDKVIIIAYCWIDEKEAAAFSPKVVVVNGNNKILNAAGKEKYGETQMGL